MKGVILAGGTGSRLRPITHTFPKQLIPVANKPVLDYAIEDLKAANVTEIGMVVGNDFDEIQSHCGDGTKYGVDITYILQGEPLGLAHAVGCARPFVGDDPFVVYLGDNMYGEGIEPLVDDFDPTACDVLLGLQPVADPTRYGVVDIDETGQIRDLVEKPDDPPSNRALIGTYVFTPKIFDAIGEIESSWRGEFEITHAIRRLVQTGSRVRSRTIDTWWKDVGTPQDVLDANRFALEELESSIQGTVEDPGSITGPVHLASGSTIEAGAIVEGPVSIAENTHVGSNAHVGSYTSIGRDSHVDDVQVEMSVCIGNNSIRTDKRLTNTLIGFGTNVAEREGASKGHRIIAGSNSTIEI